MKESHVRRSLVPPGVSDTAHRSLQVCPNISGLCLHLPPPHHHHHTKPSVTSHVSAKAHVGVCNIVSCCTVRKRYKTRWFCSEGVFHTSPSTPSPLPRYRGSLLRNEQTPNEHVVQPAARALLATGSSVLLNVSILVFVAK